MSAGCGHDAPRLGRAADRGGDDRGPMAPAYGAMPVTGRAVTIVTVLAILSPLLLIGCAMVGAVIGAHTGVVELVRYVREGLPRA